MGPPPKYLIQRKLVRRVTKQILPKNPLIPQQYYTGLVQCWKTYGFNSNKCMDQELKFDYAQQQTQDFRIRLKQLGVRQTVMNELEMPVYPRQQKGRSRKYTKLFKTTIDLMNSL